MGRINVFVHVVLSLMLHTVNTILFLTNHHRKYDLDFSQSTCLNKGLFNYYFMVYILYPVDYSDDKG